MPLYNARPTIAIPFRHAFSSGTWTDMPSAVTEFLGSTAGRIKYDLTPFSQARLVVRMAAVAGAAGSELRVQYSTDDSTYTNYLDGSTGPSTVITTNNTTFAGAWVTIVAAARADVFLRVVGAGGDGVADPVFGTVVLQVR